MRKVTQVVGVTAGALLLLGLGAGIGSAGQHTVTVEKTPASCIEALGLSAKALDLNSDMIRLAAEGITAARERDSDKLGEISDRLGVLREQFDPLADQMAPREADCRSK